MRRRRVQAARQRAVDWRPSGGGRAAGGRSRAHLAGPRRHGAALCSTAPDGRAGMCCRRRPWAARNRPPPPPPRRQWKGVSLTYHAPEGARSYRRLVAKSVTDPTPELDHRQRSSGPQRRACRQGLIGRRGSRCWCTERSERRGPAVRAGSRPAVSERTAVGQLLESGHGAPPPPPAAALISARAASARRPFTTNWPT